MTLRSRSGALRPTVGEREVRCACSCRLRHPHNERVCSGVVPAGAEHIVHVLRDRAPGAPEMTAPVCRSCAGLRWPADIWEEMP